MFCSYEREGYAGGGYGREPAGYARYISLAYTSPLNTLLLPCCTHLLRDTIYAVLFSVQSTAHFSCGLVAVSDCVLTLST